MDIDDIIEEFEAAWTEGSPPELANFLPENVGRTAQREVLLELIRVDIHHRFRGEAYRKPVEDYLFEFQQFGLVGDILSLLEEELIAHPGSRELSELEARFPDVSSVALADLLTRINRTHSGPFSSVIGPDRFGSRFELLRVLGQGGMGRVYLAFDIQLQRQIAVKVPIVDLREDPVAQQRFLREGRLAASFRHPNAVTVHEINEVGGQCFIVSEFVDGPTLNVWLSRRSTPISIRVAVEIVRNLAATVQSAHRQGILHRDLKPANVLLEIVDEMPDDVQYWIAADGQWIRPRITDFGLASCVDELSTLTTSGAMLGTAAYMAPEQATGLPLGPTADVFSIGLILFELLYGERPLFGESIVEVIDRFRTSDAINLPAAPQLPSGIRAICERCLKFDVADRYQTAKDVVSDLDRFLIGEPTIAKTSGFGANFGRILSRPARLNQAAYFAIFVEAALLASFAFILFMKAVGGPTGIEGALARMLREVSLMVAFPTLPVMALGVLTLRGNLWAYWTNLLCCTAMLGIALYAVVSGETVLSFYRGNQLATFAAHSIVLGLALLQIVLHVLALPAVRRIYRQRRWVRNIKQAAFRSVNNK